MTPKTIELKPGQYLEGSPEIKGTPATVKRWIPDKGFGFLKLEDGREIFCHVNQLCSHLSPSQRGGSPQIEREQTIYVQRVAEGRQPGKLQAENVQCECCAGPKIWELRLSEAAGDAILGVRKKIAFCVSDPSRSSYLSPIPPDELRRANVDFDAAYSKQILFERPYSDPNKFFETFGMPTAIELASRPDTLILTYPEYGTAQISVNSLFEFRDIPAKPTSQWEDRHYGVMAEFELQGVKFWATIGACGSNSIGLTPTFERLSDPTKKEIINYLQARIPAPEAKAETDFLESLKYDQEDLKKLAEQMALIRSPGLSHVTTNTYLSDAWVPLSEDERRGGYRSQEWVTTYTLHVGHKSFNISEHHVNDEPEKIKEYLASYYEKRIHDIIDKFARTMPVAQDSRLALIPPDQWQSVYRQKFDAMATGYKKKLFDQIETQVASSREEWTKREKECERVTNLYHEYYQTWRDLPYSMEFDKFSVREDFNKPDMNLSAIELAALGQEIEAGLKTLGEIRTELLAKKAEEERLRKEEERMRGKAREEAKREEVAREEAARIARTRQESRGYYEYDDGTPPDSPPTVFGGAFDGLGALMERVADQPATMGPSVKIVNRRGARVAQEGGDSERAGEEGPEDLASAMEKLITPFAKPDSAMTTPKAPHKAVSHPKQPEQREEMTEELRAQLMQELGIAEAFLRDVLNYAEVADGVRNAKQIKKERGRAQENLTALKQLKKDLTSSDNAPSMRGKVQELYNSAKRISEAMEKAQDHSTDWQAVYREMITTHIPAIEADYEGKLSPEALAAIRSKLIEIAKKPGLNNIKEAIEDIVGEVMLS